MTPTKPCFRCDQEMPDTLEHFYKTNQGKPGRLCKDCRKLQKHNNDQTRARRLTPEEKESRREYHRLYHLRTREHALAKRKEWRNKNPDRARELSRMWAEKNADRYEARRIAYRKQNYEKIEKKRQEWRDKNPERYRESRRLAAATRRARKKAAPGRFGQTDLDILFIRQLGACFYCRTILEEYHVDHFFPLAKGGSNGPENIVLACPSCNRRKNATCPHRFLQRVRTERAEAEALTVRIAGACSTS